MCQIIWELLVEFVRMTGSGEENLLLLDSLNESMTVLRCGLPPSFPHILDWVQAGLALLMGTLAFLLNAAVLLILLKYLSICRGPLLLRAQVLLLGISKAMFLSPLIYVSGVSSRWLFGSEVCHMTAFLHDASALMRVLLTVVFSLDYMLASLAPLFHLKNGCRLCLLLSLVAWLLSLSLTLTPYGCSAYIPSLKLCALYEGCPGVCPLYVPLLRLVLVPSALIVASIVLCAASFHKMKINTSTPRAGTGARKSDAVAVSGLTLSVVGCSGPSLLLYFLQLLHRAPSPALHILQVLCGQPPLYLVPVFDSVIILWQKEVWDKFLIIYHHFSPHRPPDKNTTN